MSSPFSKACYERAAERAAADPDLTRDLGLTLLTGMERLEQQSRLVGLEGGNTYHTHFPMPDGTEWELELRRRA